MNAIFANLIQTLTSEVGNSIQKHPGPGGGVPGGGREGQSTHKIGGFGGVKPPNIIFF